MLRAGGAGGGRGVQHRNECASRWGGAGNRAPVFTSTRSFRLELHGRHSVVVKALCAWVFSHRCSPPRAAGSSRRRLGHSGRPRQPALPAPHRPANPPAPMSARHRRRCAEERPRQPGMALAVLYHGYSTERLRKKSSFSDKRSLGSAAERKAAQAHRPVLGRPKQLLGRSRRRRPRRLLDLQLDVVRRALHLPTRARTRAVRDDAPRASRRQVCSL